ncbi:DUF982 domain-containing protein [Mesorhizobium sp. M1307]|uniref:DUF982 domain-containing protein n=1 Tax=Mesorhizobium sp. M1307 TaxID=2957079 RepID=UPI0033363F8A
MAILWFAPPVYVRTEHDGFRSGVHHVQAAAEELVLWTKRGPKWQKAERACMDAMSGKVSPQQAREAFEEAAKEGPRRRVCSFAD